jgi:hypothetical protein
MFDSDGPVKRPGGRTAGRPTVAQLSSNAQSNSESGPVPVAFLNVGTCNPILPDSVLVFLSSPILADQNIVLLDQRGTDTSRPRLECADVTSDSVDMQTNAESELEDVYTLMTARRACACRLVASGIDLRAFKAG